jgi:DNA-binding CsgD family transcriptional regulator
MQKVTQSNHNLLRESIEGKIKPALIWFGYDRFNLLQLSKNDHELNLLTTRSLICNWPEDKYRYYISKELSNKDPLLQKTNFDNNIFTVYDDIEHHPLEPTFAKFCKIFDIRRGFSYSVDNGDNRYILCAHGNSTSPKQTMTEEAAKVIATYCWSAMALFSFRPTPAKAALRGKFLTRRQKDCLNWAALGKTDWEIGKVLGLSRHTVHRHIEAAKSRLEVSTRVQAILALDIAMENGFSAQRGLGSTLLLSNPC